MKPLLVMLVVALAACSGGIVPDWCPDTTCSADRHPVEDDEGRCVCVPDTYDEAPESDP